MDKVYSHPPWWSYFMAIGFFIWGISSIKSWRKYKDPNASAWDKVAIDVKYLYVGIGLTATGILFLIVLIYQDCTGGIAQ